MTALATARFVVHFSDAPPHRLELHFDTQLGLELGLVELHRLEPEPVQIESATGNVLLTRRQYGQLEQTLRGLHLLLATPRTGYPSREAEPEQLLDFAEDCLYALMHHLAITPTPRTAPAPAATDSAPL